MNLLEVQSLSKTYGSGDTAVHALKNVSFSVPKGEFVAVVGESGSGKSTLLNMIGALDTPTAGQIFIDGNDILSMNDEAMTVFRRRNIGFIFQSFNLIPELTVEQNIIFPSLLDYQKPDKTYLEELLKILNLEERRSHLPSQLSGHKGTLVAGTAPTYLSAGNKSYYKCDCGKYFEDEACKVEIPDLEKWKAEGGNGYLPRIESKPEPQSESESKSPQTGDNSLVTLWVLLLALSSVSLCACLVLGKKRKNEQ